MSEPVSVSEIDHPEDAKPIVAASLADRISNAIDDDNRAALIGSFDDAHPADIADVLEQISASERDDFIRLADQDFPADVLPELEEGLRDEILPLIDPKLLADAVGEMDSDDAVYLVESLDDDLKEDVLSSLTASDRIGIERSLEYPEYSAGRMMQRDVVVVPPFWTVGQTIDMMRARDDLPEEFYEIVVTDPGHKPLGTVPLSRLMASRRPVIMDAIMGDDFRVIDANDTQEDVGYVFNQYHLVSAPVVDESGRLAGVITIDDAMQALDDETEEDLLRLGGVGDEELTDSVVEIAKQRLPWLAVNLLTAVIASAVIAQFDAVIESIVALAILMTIVASMGGNAGTQTLTVAVRALATKDITTTNAMRIISREAAVGLVNGIVFAVVMGTLTWAWYGDPALGGVLGAAMIINMIVAALAGILIPIWLEKLGADPALASAVFVTTVTDVVGFLAFLGLAALVLL